MTREVIGMEVDGNLNRAVLEISLVLFDDIGIKRTNVKQFYFLSIKLYLYRVNVGEDDDIV